MRFKWHAVTIGRADLQVPYIIRRLAVIGGNPDSDSDYFERLFNRACHIAGEIVIKLCRHLVGCNALKGRLLSIYVDL